MWQLLSKIQKNLTIAIPVMMILGLLTGMMTDVKWLKILIIPLTLLMVYPMMVNLKFQQLLSWQDKQVQLTALLINFILIPATAVVLSQLFLAEQPYAALGLLLAALVPTSGMTISWTGFANGNLSAAIKMTIIGLIIGSLLTPIYANVLMGQSVPIPIAKVFRSIVFVVFLPMLLGYLTKGFLVKNYGLTHYQQHLAKKFPPISTLGVLGIVFVAMALNAPAIMARPQALIDFIIPLALLYLINFILSSLIGKWLFDRGDAIALVYGTVMRNLSIALAIAMTAFGTQGAQIAIIIALAYIIQVQAAAWYVKYTDKIFGKEQPSNGRQPPISIHHN